MQPHPSLVGARARWLAANAIVAAALFVGLALAIASGPLPIDVSVASALAPLRSGPTGVVLDAFNVAGQALVWDPLVALLALALWVRGLTSPNSLGRGWPFSLFSSGLGSNVSRWLGPPAINRKMTDFALAVAAAALRALLVQHRRERQAAETAEGVGQELTSIARRFGVLVHRYKKSFTRNRDNANSLSGPSFR